MLFHSKEFLFYLLPAVFSGWLLLVFLKRFCFALAWVTLGSFVFYAYWNPPYLAILLGSVFLNFLIGKVVDPLCGKGAVARFRFLAAGVCVNLLLLGYYKYANFFVDTINQAFQIGWTMEKVFLPLGISFFTFQQIAYLVDSYRGQARGHSFLDYAFFVSFFPQLIAGPIIHHGEILAQLRRGFSLRNVPLDLLLGLSIFVVGLFKKMVLADSCGVLASGFFGSAGAGLSFTAEQSWCGSLAYTLQIYFDFSGYSDMAIGLARIFSFKLPENFAAPYRATSVVEFWRRWHITLSRFLRDYLYIPLGGNRQGSFFRYRNLFVTMLLGGLWHGAGWTFVAWGGLHGLYLVANHMWNTLLEKFAARSFLRFGWFARVFGWSCTMLAVVAAWVFFRAESMASALQILASMAGHSAGGEGAYTYPEGFWFISLRWPFLVFLAALCLVAPKTQSYFQRYVPTLESASGRCCWWQWKPNFFHGALIGFLLLVVIKQSFSLAPSEFLYFNF